MGKKVEVSKKNGGGKERKKGRKKERMAPPQTTNRHYYTLFFSILLFVSAFSTIHLSRPSAVYARDGSFREFGVGYSRKTVFSIWVVSIVTGIASYFAARAAVSSF